MSSRAWKCLCFRASNSALKPGTAAASVRNFSHCIKVQFSLHTCIDRKRCKTLIRLTGFTCSVIFTNSSASEFRIDSNEAWNTQQHYFQEEGADQIRVTNDKWQWNNEVWVTAVLMNIIAKSMKEIIELERSPAAQHMTSYIVGTFLYQNMFQDWSRSWIWKMSVMHESEGTKDFWTSAGWGTGWQQISFPAKCQ